MIEIGVPDTIDKLISQWHKKRGLAFAVLLAFGIVYMIIDYFDKDKNLAQCYAYSFILLFILLLSVWVFTTKRVVFRHGCDLSIGVMLKVDEVDETQSVFKISKGTIEKLNGSDLLQSVNLFFLPTNFLKSNREVKKFISRNSNSLDVVLILHTNSGNIEGDHQTKIENFEFVYNLGNLPFERSVLNEKINFISEIRLQNFHKNWAILNSNSFNDREKLKTNLEELLHHAIAIKYILLGKAQKALVLLEKILDQEFLKIKFEDKEKTKIKLKPQMVSHSRILHLLTTLYIAISEEYMYSNPQKTLYFLERLENLLNGQKNKYSLKQYVMMARMYYESANLEKAIEYTNRAELLKPKETAIFMNRIFFGILKQDWNMIHKNLQIIYHNKNKIDYGVIDVVDFLIRERKRYPLLDIEFDYVIHSYELMFLEQPEARLKFQEIVKQLEGKNISEKVIHLAHKILRDS